MPCRDRSRDKVHDMTVRFSLSLPRYVDTSAADPLAETYAFANMLEERVNRADKEKRDQAKKEGRGFLGRQGVLAQSCPSGKRA